MNILCLIKNITNQRYYMEIQTNSPLRKKSRDFAIRIINLYKYIKTEKKEFTVTNQILRCGTSIGANIAESECAISKKDFLSKIYIAQKECNETIYWSDILHETDYLNDKEYISLQEDCIELMKMLKATTKTMVKSLDN